ncbi:cyclodeaminase/cyclohydrolase family protein [Vreelandella populi]|uniref:cyclodeaminase/cyclohydrolase family protein n=1 Tax=Halomonadaceae TaxID=28256 RepID=UPI00159A83C4|nr:MBL fold metallo-hydrolase [Halomonas sp. PA5]
MEIIFLGTSAGVPTRARNVSATALRKHNAKGWYLVDCGEGTQHRILRTPLSLNRLEAIAITHLHGDHCYGLPGLLASASMAGRTRALSIVGPASVKGFLEVIEAASGLHLTFPLLFSEVDTQPGAVELPDFTLEAGALSHGVASYAYAFTERNLQRSLDTQRLEAQGIARGPVWGRLYRGEDVSLDDGTTLRSDDYLLPARRARRVVVGGDNDTPRLLATLCKGADVLVHEATYTHEIVERLGTDNQHSTAAAVATFGAEQEIANLVLTHFSPRYVYRRNASPSITDIEREALAHYQGNLFLANDFDRYRLSREGVLEEAERINAGSGRASSSLWSMPLTHYREAIVSKPTPGCGSVAAVTAVSGLGLVIKALKRSGSGRRGSEKSTEEASRRQTLIDEAQALIETLNGYADEDAQALEAYLDAQSKRGEAKGDPSEAARRMNEVPLETAKACLDALRLTVESLAHSKQALRSDVLAGGLLLHSGLGAVLFTVDADLASLEEGEEKQAMAETRARLQQQADSHMAWLRQQPVS